MASPARTLFVGLTTLLLASPLAAQQPPVPPAAPASTSAKLSIEQLRALAEAQAAIAVVLDSSGAELAQVKNKTLQAQAEMQAKRRTLVSAALTKKGLTVDEFERQRFVVSTDTRMRFQFDSIVARLTGQPLPGTVVAAAAPALTVPTSIVNIAIGYLTAGYIDTPDKSGLLTMATTEAKVAAQHAGFMSRAMDNLQTLQMHAGHVLHAIDPGTMPGATAPGKNYGDKRALDGAMAYADCLAKNPNASANVKTHAAHIIGAAKSTAERADDVIAMARKIRSATTAAQAAALVGQLQSLCDQLVAGADLNSDGRIVWNGGEGGIQQAQEHVALMVAGEKKP